ncbi:MAG: ATP-dependent DNA ligase [Geodermatophilaceae bacterium]|nr:ATP-dependent DNA ligase [Geodermatophilaceae bacterium]MDQ3465289.1 ATP-dependent DNA ligase [Actinomycetota bacterium]
MLFADVVAASATVAATRSRLAKIQAAADLLRRLAPEEVEPVVAWLAGEPRQGRIGTGWRTLSAIETAPADVPGLTVAAVDSALTTIAGTSGAGSVQRRADTLGRLFGAATADEQAFLRRLLTGELRQGALEGVMVAAVAAASGCPLDAVRRAFMLSGRLPDTAAAALGGGTPALAGIGLEVGRPVRPMLAATASSLDEALAELGTEVAVEYKLDGARIQVHRDGSDVGVFTRSLRDITPAVPELVVWALALPCRSVVLDGESLALTDEGRPRPFQESVSLAGAGVQRPNVFDCLHLDGQDLIDLPLLQRLDTVTAVAGPERIPGRIRPDPAGAAAVLTDSLASGHEGVMVKALGSPYAAGRRGRAWQKVKPVHTFDLVVLGAEWGYGRRTGMLSNIHLGALDTDGEPVMVGKTFKGMTDELLAWQTATFPALSTGTDGHVVYLRPELVVEIALDGVQHSTRYPGGLALRFARVLRYRPDKSPAEADSLTALRALLVAYDG